MNIFIPITKVDAKKRLVYGIITQEVVDKSGEMFDYESGKPEIEKWSAAISEATGGKSKGNLRSMHGSIAAGKFTNFHYDDDKKTISASAKVVDDDEWKKVEEGVYSGFSIGGGYKKRWVCEENPGVMRFTPTIAEVSLVDNPCVPTATFEYIKADGGHEIRKFHTNNTNEDPMTVKKLLKVTTEIAEKLVKGESVEGFTGKAYAELDVTALCLGDQKALEAALKTVVSDPQKTADVKDVDDKPVVEKNDPATAPAKDPAAEPAPVVKVVDGKKVMPETEPVSKWVASDGSLHDKKDGARDRNLELESAKKLNPANELLKQIDAALTKAEGKEEAEEEEEEDEETKKTKKAKKEADDAAIAAKEKEDAEAADKAAKSAAGAKPELQKGLYDIGTFANILQNICWLQSGAESERKWEGDNSTLPEALKAWLKTGSEILKAYVEEEVSELFPAEVPEVEVLAMAAKMSGEHCDALAKFVKGDALKSALSKAGSRHSKSDKDSLKAIHKSATDHADGIMKCLKDIGAMDDEKEEDSTTAAKAAGGGDDSLTKRELESERKKTEGLEKHIDTLSESLQKVLQRIESLERQPMPAKGAVRSVSKSQDAGAAGDGEALTQEQVQEAVRKMSPEQRTLLALKVSLGEGQVLAK